LISPCGRSPLSKDKRLEGFFHGRTLKTDVAGSHVLEAGINGAGAEDTAKIVETDLFADVKLNHYRSGTAVARESAAVILIGSDPSKLVETLRVARRCRGIIMQNFGGTLVVDSVGVGMAAFGLLNPLLAAFIHVTSELAFILNSTRLLPRSSEAGQ
jgi:high-affinity K+ transport system ATPase subunit B